MLHLLTNTNSSVKIDCYVKYASLGEYCSTDEVGDYVPMSSTETIRLDIKNFEFRKDQSISNARIVCFFDELNYEDILVLTDSTGKIIDKVIVGLDGEYLSNKKYNYVSFDVTKFLEKNRKQRNIDSLYMNWKGSYKTITRFLSFNSIDESNKNLDVVSKKQYLYFSYANIDGVESHFSYIEKNLGATGIALVNLKQGHLISEFPLSVNNLDIDNYIISLTYNSLNCEEKTPYGKGVKGPFDYEFDCSLKSSDGIIKLTDPTLKKSYYYLLNSDERYRLTSETELNVYYCFADSSYILDNKVDYELIYDNKKMIFSKNGQVQKIVFPRKTVITINYNKDNLPSEIVYNNSKDTFEYSDGMLVKYVSNRFGIETRLSYENFNLSYICTEKISLDIENNMKKCRDIVRESYLIYKENLLTKICNSYELKAIKFKYENDKVKQIIECLINGHFNNDDNDVDGKNEILIYGINNTILIDNVHNKKYYHFDSYGSCDYTLDENCVSDNFKYGTTSTSDKNMDCHVVRSQFKSVSNIPNLIYNGSFECENDPLFGWNIDSESNATYSFSNEGLYGESCLVVKANETNIFQFSQSFIQKKNGSFILTGFYKTKNNKTNTCGKINLQIKNENNEIIKEIEITLNNAYYGEWQKFTSEIIDIPLNSLIKISISCYDEIYFDALQLTKNNFISSQNYIKNSHFENNYNGAVRTWETFNTTLLDGVVDSSCIDFSSFLNEMIEGNIFKLSGTNESVEKELSQKIKLNGDSGENLIANCWIYGDKTTNEKLQLEISVHYTNLKTDKLKKYKFSLSNNNEGWQILTGIVRTEYSYDYVIVKIIHNGFNDIYIDAFQMFKSKNGSNFSYSENGNIMSISNNDKKIESSYDKQGRLIRKSCADGQNYQYVYNDKDILIGIKDNFGNDVSFDYQKDGVIKEIKSNDQIIRTVEYKDEDGCFTKIDELENVTKTIKDEFGNVISYIDGKGNIIRRVFNAQQKPIEIERYNQEEKPINASIKYNRFNKVEEILCSNGSKINIEYDEFGNKILEKINDAPLAYYRYIEPYNSLVNLYSFISNNETPKGVEYDSKGKIKSVYSGNDKIADLKYDDTGKLVEMKNISLVKDEYFNYDSNGKLISITDSYDNKISYDLDNLGNVEKETIKLFDSRMASSFIHDYEFNEADRTTFFDRLSRTYQDEIIVGDHGADGLYGAKPKSSAFRFTYDELVKMNTLELAYAGKELSYQLSKINSNRQNDLSSGGQFNKFLWNLNFKHSKTAYGWLRVLGEIDNKTIFTFNGEKISIKLIALTENKLRLWADGIEKDLLVTKNNLKEWNMFALSVFDQDTSTKVCFYLNGIFLTMIEIKRNVTDLLTDFVIGDRKLLDGQTSSYQEMNKTPIRIAFLSIGAYHYKKINFKAINDIGRKFLFDSKLSDTFSGVSVELCNGEGDYISLNGSFKSLSGLAPIITAFSDGTFKVDKSRNFEFDKEILRHAYSCYDGIYKLKDQNASRLTYDLSRLNYDKIQLRFKPILFDEESMDKRTIFSLMNNKATIKVYLDKNNYVNLLIGDNEINTRLKAINNRWNTILLDFNGSITLNDSSCTISTIEKVVYKLNVGCSIKIESGNEIPHKYLNGLICDIYLTNKSDYNFIHNASFLNIKDEFGRKRANQIRYDGNVVSRAFYQYVIPKKYNNQQIKYRTSLSIAKEENPMNKINYAYDSNKNVTFITKENDLGTSVMEYKYDVAERLISSNKNNGEEINTYSYDDNGNIASCIKEIDGTKIETTYVYDSKNKERLLEVIEGDNKITLTYEKDSMYPSTIGNITLLWTEDKLYKYKDEDKNIGYSYDYLGRLEEKQVNGDIIQYLYDKDKLIAEIKYGFKKYFIYDEKNDLVGFVNETNGIKESYFFIKNNLNIIDGVVDSKGEIVAKYLYDDFGMLLNIDEIDFELNDIFYKGYLYDQVTGWYYLSGRHYSPKLKRFISPDKVDNLIYGVADLVQFNLFSYCDNNPIMRKDNNGQSWFINLLNMANNALNEIVKTVVTATTTLVGTVVGAAIGAVVGVCNGIANGESFEDGVKLTIQGISDGAKMGFSAGESIGLMISGAITLDKDTISDGVNTWNSDVVSNFYTFAQNNITGIMTLGDVIHDGVIGLGTLAIAIGNPLGFVVGGACIGYYVFQEVIAEKNYYDNIKVIGENEENLIGGTNNINGYLKPQFSHNVVIDDKVYITNQSDIIFQNIKFGVSTMNNNGCAVMATYNLLRFLNINMKLVDIIYYYEKRNLVFGGLGVWPSHMKKLFTMLQIDYDTSIKVEDLKYYTLNKYKCFITTYFNNRWNPSNGNTSIKYNLSAHTTAWVPLNNYCYEYDIRKGLIIDTNKLYEINGGFGVSNSIYQNINNASNAKLISVFGIK